MRNLDCTWGKQKIFKYSKTHYPQKLRIWHSRFYVLSTQDIQYLPFNSFQKDLAAIEHQQHGLWSQRTIKLENGVMLNRSCTFLRVKIKHYSMCLSNEELLVFKKINYLSNTLKISLEVVNQTWGWHGTKLL